MRGEKGNSPLHIAAAGGSVSIAEALLVSGANKDALNNVGDTPLIKAARGGRLSMVKSES